MVGDATAITLPHVTDDWHLGMYTIRNQRTIAAPARVAGIGYWSGREIHVEFRPAPIDAGVFFVRGDLPGDPRIPASVYHRTETPRRTTLQYGAAGVDMIEHIMAALAGLQIDNCEVRVDGQEMPGCDGSALPFVQALDAAGIVEQAAARRVLPIREVLRLGNEQSWIEARPCRSGKTILRYELDYGSGTAIGRQSLEITLSPKLFHLSLAPSRTFMLESEAAALQAQGLGQQATCKDLLVFDSRGPIGNELRFPDECVRHKLLDMVGDLAMAGCDLVGRIVAYRSGHRLNAEMVRAVLAQNEVQQERKRCA
jgi:UDP-3-O-[3-hydroxymyristoyl] N-acetylglucosamine deacetylase